MEKFFASDVEKITGVKRTRLQQWLEKGFLSPSIHEAEGHGDRNIYSRIDIYNIAVFKKISESGLQRKVAADLIGCGVLPPDLSRAELYEINYLLFFRKENKHEGIYITYTKDQIERDGGVVLDLTYQMEVTNMDNFDDMHLINFVKIRNEVDKNIVLHMAEEI